MAGYIEQTIKSVLDQNYPNLEYIIIDADSNDGTLDIIRKYKGQLAKIISEPDEGQYFAIQKGMDLATGDIMAWLNADDIYFPWTLHRINELFTRHTEVKWASGMSAFIDDSGNLTNFFSNVNAKPSKLIRSGYYRSDLLGFLQQESMFWRREIWQSAGGLDTRYKLAGDFELWTRFARFSEHVTIGLPLAGFRIRKNSRSRLNEDKYLLEVKDIAKQISKPVNTIARLTGAGQVINKLIRLMVWKKSWIYYFSVSKNSWLLRRKRRPVSTVSLNQLMLEI